MTSIIDTEAPPALGVLTENDIDRVSGGLPLLVGWAIYAGVGFALGVGSAYGVKLLKAK
ncbi:hypothetical protein HF313_04075 [Massilia atriviolacea]|uniref:hypothetical protein n=1 Tax=Massilia atriviolacea TaxID=2495579 RepID=UPI0013DFD705|nr:hypothetical protein [Massilia atriviolacea]